MLILSNWLIISGYKYDRRLLHDNRATVGQTHCHNHPPELANELVRVGLITAVTRTTYITIYIYMYTYIMIVYRCTRILLYHSISM